jgi:hypothetical protein
MTMPSESTYVRVLNGYDADLFVHTPPQSEMRVAEALGKPLLVSAGPEVSRFPEEACLRVDRGPAEDESLAALMLLLRQRPDLARAAGAAAAHHIAVEHAPAHVADLYVAALTAARNQ